MLAPRLFRRQAAGVARLAALGYTTGMQRGQTTIWLGTSGWSYPDWNGTVYPRSKPRGFHPLGMLAEHFNAVEVNSSFYQIPDARHTESWTTLTPQEFRFAFKLTRVFTHENDRRPAPADVAAFRAALEPVRAAGKLGPLLVQFPWSFRYAAENAEHIRRLAELFAAESPVFEVRHSTWEAPEALELLSGLGGVCNIDQPRLHDCLAPAARVCGSTGYIRLHGRNAPMWFADNVPAYERYNYLYSDAELHEWIERINAMCARARELYIFTNNHYRGQAPANALQLRALLSGERVSAPDELLRTYPHLRTIAKPPREPTLFDPPTDDPPA